MYIKDLLFSLRTAIWLCWLIITAMLAGAFIMPTSAAFKSIHGRPFFEWLMEQSFGVTWWLWACIIFLCLLAVNTLCCSFQSLFKKRSSAKWLLVVSPQVIHAGFLFMLLAHLMSGLGASTQMVVAGEGQTLQLQGSEAGLLIRSIDAKISPAGYMEDWSVETELAGQKEFIRPNQPIIHAGLNIGVKDLQAYPYKAVLIQINKDPGAIWALIGGVLFLLGVATLIILKVRVLKDQPPEQT